MSPASAARLISGVKKSRIAGPARVFDSETEVMTAGGDFGHLEPMLEATRRELHTIGVEETPRKFGSPSFPVYGYDVRLLRGTASSLAIGTGAAAVLMPGAPTAVHVFTARCVPQNRCGAGLEDLHLPWQKCLEHYRR